MKQILDINIKNTQKGSFISLKNAILRSEYLYAKWQD